jgi:hypothetical protein
MGRLGRQYKQQKIFARLGNNISTIPPTFYSTIRENKLALPQDTKCAYAIAQVHYDEKQLVVVGDGGTI